MGFGPKTPDVESGVQAVAELMELLYPERSTPQALMLLRASARALLSAKAPLTFDNIARFWQDPQWRRWIQGRWDSPLPGPWDGWDSVSVDPSQLDPNFGWLLADRIAANRESDEL